MCTKVAEDERESESKLLTYLADLKKLKSPNKEVQDVLDKNIRELGDTKLALRLIMLNVSHFDEQINDELSEEEMMDIYSNIPILAQVLPNYRREVKNLLTLKQKEIAMLVMFIEDLIEVFNTQKK